MIEWSEPIPFNSTSLKIPLDTLSKLPTGVWYFSKEGRASVMAGRDKNNNLIVESACDSVTRRCLFLEEENARLRESVTSEENKPVDTGPSGWQWFWIRTGQLLSVAAFVLLSVKIIKSKILNK